MYLKEGNEALAMQDITVLLALDSKHIKGRVRRARIYEEQASVSPGNECRYYLTSTSLPFRCRISWFKAWMTTWLSWCTAASVRRHAQVRYSVLLRCCTWCRYLWWVYFFLIRPPCVLMAVDEKKFETIAKQIAQQRTPQVYIHTYINTYLNSFGDKEIEWPVCCNGSKWLV